MSTREDRLLAGKQLFAKVLQSDVKILFDRTKAELEDRLAADESVAGELPDGTRIGSVKRSKPRKTASVTDEQALLAWVAENRPGELVHSINPAYLNGLKAQVKNHGHAFDPVSGEIIPGIEMVESGPSFLPQIDEDQVPLIRRTLADLITGGLLELPAADDRRTA